MKHLKIFFLITDIGFILYWIATGFHLIPESWAFNDYTNSILVAWNWSFFPLDMCISATGLLSIYLFNRTNLLWKKTSLISLALTFCSGLQAVSFWTLRLDFDITWWALNLYLLIYPLFFMRKIIVQGGIEQ